MEILTITSLPFALGAMLIGIALLIYGGNWTIDAAVHVAKRLGMPPLIVGFTILAFGTSLPELIVSVFANLGGSPGIAIGNVIGSNIANMLMVIGVTALFVTLHTISKAVIKDLIMMLVSTSILAGLLLFGEIGRLAGLAMLFFLCAYIFLQYKMSGKGEMPPEEMEEPTFSSERKAYFFLITGMLSIALGAEFLVRGAVFSAAAIGVPEAVIALSVIALGTSLPELSTCIIAAKKGQSEIVLGNIIGSNVFNILMIIGATALIKPISQGTFTVQLIDFDIWILTLVSTIFALILIFRGKITRINGIIFCAAYMLYNVYIYAIYIGG